MARTAFLRLSATLASSFGLLLFVVYLLSNSSSQRVLAGPLGGSGRSQRSLLREESRDGTTASQGGHLWDLVLVINLAHRKDRRVHMDKLSAALGIPFTFVDAITTADPVVPWVLERLLEEQERAEGVPGGLEALVPDADWGGQGETWRAKALRVLKDQTTPYDLSRSPNDLRTLVYPPAYRQTAAIDPAGPTACWLSHLKAMAAAIDSGAQSVLILEDDVDAEFDLASRWQEMSKALATHDAGWDMVYLGFIWANERFFKPTVHPGLRRAFEPAGGHAYSLSHRGARRLFSLALAEPTLFQRPLDHEIPLNFIASLRLAEERGEPHPWDFEAFTAVPPLVVPGGEYAGLGTDIGGIGGTLWGGLLADSAARRIAAHEGHPFARPTEAQVLAMLAVQQM